MTLLSFEHVTKRFPGVTALDDVSFAVEAGEIHALLGENGAGKSTLIKVLGGAHVPDDGSVLVDGKAIPLGDPLAAQECGVQVIHQELTLIPELTVTENVFLGRELGGILLDRAAMREKTQSLLLELGARFSPDARAGSLSVADQQLVEIARALVTESKVLVLDEPTGTLHQREVDKLFEVLRGLRSNGLGVVYISHRLEEIFELTDRVTVLRDGRWVETKPTRETDRASLVRAMVGRSLDEEFPLRSPSPGEAVLEVRGLSVPGRVVSVDFDVRRGEIVGLYGLVGSGRTSTALALFGAVDSGGDLRLNDQSYAPKSPTEAIRRGVGYITEDRKGSGIFADLGTGSNMTITFLQKFARGSISNLARERSAAEALRREFDVRCASLEQRAGTLSGGNQQKLLLARMLLEERVVLVLDEPTRGIDVGAKSEIYRLMNELTESGVAIVMISSELPEILGMSDRIVVLQDGKSVGEVARDVATQEVLLDLATHEEEAA